MRCDGVGEGDKECDREGPVCLGNVLGEVSQSRASMACRAGGERPGRCRAGALGVFKALDETGVVDAHQDTGLCPEPAGQTLAWVPGAQGSPWWVVGAGP